MLHRLSEFFPSNAFLRRRRKKALLRVNDRGGVWRMCILALCRACVCVRVFCTCVRAPLSNLSCARNSLYVQCLYSVYTVYTERERYVVVQCMLVNSTHKMSPFTVEVLKSIYLFLYICIGKFTYFYTFV